MDARSAAWTRPGDEDGEWTIIKDADAAPQLTSLSVLWWSALDTPWLFAVDDLGKVYVAESPWTNWVGLP
ncbi:MAG: hypothetical protein JW751_30740 [Polyangiaceae bacterium]|nr:hypothetical protein [Polyangiaceae bacterium]